MIPRHNGGRYTQSIGAQKCYCHNCVLVIAWQWIFKLFGGELVVLTSCYKVLRSQGHGMFLFILYFYITLISLVATQQSHDALRCRIPIERRTGVPDGSAWKPSPERVDTARRPGARDTCDHVFRQVGVSVLKFGAWISVECPQKKRFANHINCCWDDGL